jgi:signal transduction histidine kinase
MYDELSRSEDKLREAVATKDKFFSIIAHDLKNPLQAMILNSYTLANNYDKMDKVKLNENFEKLHKSSHYLAELLENLLQWARTQSGNIEFSPDLIDMYSLTENTVNLLKESAIRKNITLNQMLEPRNYVYCDLNMISSVMRNLLTNAIKFTHLGGEVWITSADRGELVEFIIADNGMGMKNTEMNKLFRIDIHHSNIGTSKEKGTGLGLILSKEFIEKNGGNIWTESEYGKGSKFIFTLPKHPKHQMNISKPLLRSQISN